MPPSPGLSWSRAAWIRGHLERVGTRQLLHNDQEPGAAAVQAIADQRLMVLDQVRNLLEPQRGALDGEPRHIARLCDGQHVPDADALVRGLDEAARTRDRGLEEAERRIPQRVAGRPDDLTQRTPVVAQLLGVDAHLQLALALAPDRHVRHTRNAQQARPDRPAGEHRHLDQRQLARAQAHHHHPVLGRQRLQHLRGLRHVGQGMRLRKSLGDDLAGTVDVVRLEGHDD